MSENSYDQSIGKIKETKPEILMKLKEREKKKDSAKAILELQQKAGLRSKSGSRTNKRDKGKYGNRDKNRSTSKENGPKDGNGYYLCGNFNKTHTGVCQKPVQGTSTDQNTTPRKDWMTKKATWNYIKQIVTSESKKKIRKGKGKRRYSSDSSSSEESSSDGALWRSGMSGAEQSRCICLRLLGSIQMTMTLNSNQKMSAATRNKPRSGPIFIAIIVLFN